MKSKQISFRTIGQKTLDSSFLNSSSNPVSIEDSGNENSAKNSRLSLSDFLKNKLKESREELPGTVKGKLKPFSSLVGQRELNGSVGEQSEAKKVGESPTLTSIVEKAVLDQFKPIVKVEDHVDLTGSGDEAAVEGSRKRKFEGGYEKQIHRKHFGVLGGNPKRKQQRRNKIISSTEDQVPSYNHYANGGGFWDSNMEGVDNEEVGFSEVWEGVGSTTFGDVVDWH